MSYLVEFSFGSYTLATVADTPEEGQRKVLRDLRKRDLPTEFATELENYRVESIDAMTKEVVWR